MMTKLCRFMWHNHASHYRPYNYGVAGYGPHHMLAQLQRGNLTKEIHETHGIAVYTFIDHHINRAIGAMREYNPIGSSTSPIYTLDAHDRLVRQESATFGRPLVSLLSWGLGKSQILTHYHITFPPSPASVRSISDSRRESLQKRVRLFTSNFPALSSTCCCIPASDVGRPSFPTWHRLAIKYLDYSNFIDWPHPGIDPARQHASDGTRAQAGRGTTGESSWDI